MSLHENIKKEIQEAMKARDDVRLRTLRGLVTAFTNELVTHKKKPDEILDDTIAQTVIQREAKKRSDSIEQFTKGNREDLAEREQEELAVLETYLPEMMSREEVFTVVTEKKDVLDIQDSSQKGQLIGAVMKDLKGRADGGVVKEIVDELLS